MDRSFNGITFSPSRLFVAGTVSLAIVFAPVAAVYVRQYSISTPAAIAVYLAFTLLLILSVVPAAKSTRTIDRTAPRYLPFLFVLIWCTPYLIYAAGTGDFRWTALIKLLLIAAFPVAIYGRFPPRNAHAFSWQDASVAVFLIGAVLSRRLTGIWNVPTNLDFLNRLFLITVAAWSWTFIRPVPELGYSFRVSREVVRQAAINFAFFAAIAMPAGLAMHFTRWNPRWPGAVQFLLNYLEIFLFIAVLEELFFRGFLQNLLSKTLGSWVAGQTLVSLLFGMFHILHAPFPNWRYVALASVAGWFYGSAYRISGSLMASALLHAGVDTFWRTWFSAT
ncbi:MAG: CPBP family intramembrane metalloprotease [Acidobacteriota bacterium]|nr:CPBP family intramembrane metalloprotease [Acidobacteriota bacterium]